MKKILTLLFLCQTILSLWCLKKEDVQFIYRHELWDWVEKHSQDLNTYMSKNPDDDVAWQIREEMCRVKKDTLSMVRIYAERAKKQQSLNHALWALTLTNNSKYKLKKAEIDSLTSVFHLPFSKEILSYTLSGDEKKKKALIKKYYPYKKQIEQWAKEEVDAFSVEPDPSKRLTLIRDFLKTYPRSRYVPMAYYYKFFTQKSLKRYHEFYEESNKLFKKDSPAEMLYILSNQCIDPVFRKNYYHAQGNLMILNQAMNRLKIAQKKLEKDKRNEFYVNTVPWSKTYLKNKILLDQARIKYYLILNKKNQFGEETEESVAIRRSDKNLIEGLDLLRKIKFDNNDFGEQAAIHFWYARFLKDIDREEMKKEAIDHLISCMQFGSPRNPYEKTAIAYLQKLMSEMGITTDMMAYARSLEKYDGPVFTDITASAGLGKISASRIAWGDYNNDGWDDLLLSGNLIYKNNGNMTFSNMTDSLRLGALSNNGGIWADFDQDGKLDFSAFSSSDKGDMLMVNRQDRFLCVNDRAGDIDDKSPSEAMAWIDTEKDGYPDLFTANYELWGLKSGYRDYYWENQKGYFSDQTKAMGFDNTRYPELAGRGIAPADFDNDGDQEIFVTNYRLNRNLLWDKTEKGYGEIAGLTGLQGVNQEGYYGHSIGADWGDFDNDGDLDVFIANLAHPRYLDFSDISQLMRNNGIKTYILKNEKIKYYDFEDITQQSGITYDETHSDPLWFDADNDGDLDLFITGIYPNERSYFYVNQGNGKFVDRTWLSGLRTFNSWGNAFADIDHDGKLDLFVASGEGVHLYHNTTQNENKSVIYRPVRLKDEVRLLPQSAKNYQNTPAYGARIEVVTQVGSKKIKRIRELCSAKGTGSQNAQILHFGIGKEKLIKP